MRIDPQKKEERLLKRLVNLKEKVVLEIGCGDGRISFLLAPLSKKFIGIDVEPKVIIEATRKIPGDLREKLEFRTGFGHQINLPSESIDTILMVLTLHEIALQYQGPTLKEAWRVLKEKGQLFIADPLPFGQVQRLYDVVNRQIILFNHPVAVKHSQEALKIFIKQGWFRLVKKTNLRSDWHFDSFVELYQFIQEEYSSEVNWDDKNCQILKKGLERVVGKAEDKPIVVWDEMKVYVLKKEKRCQA